MISQNPLVPQGTLQPRAKSNLVFKVMLVLAVHVVVIGVLLLQGCKDTKDTEAIRPASDAAMTVITPSIETLPTVPTSTSVPKVVTAKEPQNIAQNPPATVQELPVTQLAPQAPVPSHEPPPAVVAFAAAPAATEGREYVVGAGDSIASIARKSGVTTKALMEANPGVNPKKLYAGQILQIPAAAGAVASTPSPAAATPEVAAAPAETTVYKVKPGDTLAKIARLYHTTYKKIMAANALKTSTVKPGQILKLPPLTTALAATPATAAN